MLIYYQNYHFHDPTALLQLVSSDKEVWAKNPAEAAMGRSRRCLDIVGLPGMGSGASAAGGLEACDGTRMVINSD